MWLLARKLNRTGKHFAKKPNLITLEEVTPDAQKLVLDDADVIIVRSTAKISGEMLKPVKNLRGIIKWGVGYENIDVAAAARTGLPVVILPVFLASLAEAVFAFFLPSQKNTQRLML